VIHDWGKLMTKVGEERMKVEYLHRVKIKDHLPNFFHHHKSWPKMQLIDQLCEIKVNLIFTLNRRLIGCNKIQ